VMRKHGMNKLGWMDGQTLALLKSGPSAEIKFGLQCADRVSGPERLRASASGARAAVHAPLETDGTDSPDLTTCTQQFLTLIESFPDAARELWNGCTSRIFSCGFEGGCDGPALDTTITADLLLRIAKLGADIAITVYPYRPNGELFEARPIEAP
jgi:hypothetical protein